MIGEGEERKGVFLHNHSTNWLRGSVNMGTMQSFSVEKERLYVPILWEIKRFIAVSTPTQISGTTCSEMEGRTIGSSRCCSDGGGSGCGSSISCARL